MWGVLVAFRCIFIPVTTLLEHRNSATTKKIDFKNSHLTSVGAMYYQGRHVLAKISLRGLVGDVDGQRIRLVIEKRVAYWGHLNYNESRKSQNQRHEANKNNDTRILAAELASL